MDAFEAVIAALLHQEGYWTLPSFKVDLTKADKAAISRPSCPRWEIDLVAYHGSTNRILAVECKSLLDSPGVGIKPFTHPDHKSQSRFKLFTNEILRTAVLNRLAIQLVEAGFCRRKPKVTLALAAGKIISRNQREQLHEHFKMQGWKLFDEKWIRERLSASADRKYENAVATITAKLLLRG